MSFKSLFFIGLFSFFTGLCIYAPAQMMGIILNQISNGRLSLADTEGSFWLGNAHLLMNSDNQLINTSQPTETIDLGRVSWDTQAMQLLVGKIAVSLTLNQGTPFWITVDSSRVHIEHAAFNLPANIVSILIPTLKPAQLGGQLEVRCDNFSLTQQEVLGQLNIDWSQTSSSLSNINPLGNYHANLNGNGAGLSIQLNTISTGPLLLSGNGSWDPSDGLHFEGSAEASAAEKQQLQALLRVMGNETIAGSGQYQLRF